MKVSILFFSQIIFWYIHLSPFNSYFIRFFFSSSIRTGPDPIIGLGGLILFIPLLLFILGFSILSSFLISKFLPSEMSTAAIIISFVLSYLSYEITVPYIFESRSQNNSLDFLQKDISENIPYSFRIQSEYQFENEHWFLQKLISEPEITSILNNTFGQNNIVIKYNSGMDLLPMSAFAKYPVKAGTSLSDTLKGAFDVNVKVNNQVYRIKTPSSTDEPYLKILNSVFIGRNHLGLHLKIANGTGDFVFFIPAKKAYDRHQKPYGTYLKKFKNIDSIILSK